MAERQSQWLKEEIERLQARMPKAPKGSREAALACFELWGEDPDAPKEAERLLREVEADREQYLLPVEDKQP